MKMPYQIGQKYLVRTVTFIYTGRLSYIDDRSMVLQDAAWVADTGRFTDALKNGELSEVEPYPEECILERGCIVDSSPWNHKLPREQV